MWYERREVGEVFKTCWIGMIGITSGRKIKRDIYTGESIKKRWVLGVVAVIEAVCSGARRGKW